MEHNNALSLTCFPVPNPQQPKETLRLLTSGLLASDSAQKDRKSQPASQSRGSDMAKFRGGKGQSNGIWKFSVQSSHISSISAFHYAVLLKYKGGLPSKQLLIVQGLSAATNEYDLESGFDHRLPPIYRSWIHHFRGEQAGSPNPKQYSLGSFSGPKIVLDNPYLDWMTVSPGVKKTIRRSCTMHFPRSAGQP